MEENFVNLDIEVSANKAGGGFIFKIKDQSDVNRAIHNSIQGEYFAIGINSVVVYPENSILESDRIFLESTAVLL